MGFKYLAYNNDVLKNLNAFSSVNLADSVINYTEENFCYLNVFKANDIILYFIALEYQV